MFVAPSTVFFLIFLFSLSLSLSSSHLLLLGAAQQPQMQPSFSRRISFKEKKKSRRRVLLAPDNKEGWGEKKLDTIRPTVVIKRKGKFDLLSYSFFYSRYPSFDYTALTKD